MSNNRYKVVSCDGYKFFFKFESDPPDILHIYARGLFEPKDAIRVWNEGTEETENLVFSRFETYTETHGIYWLWLDTEKTKVLIISCFKRM